MDVKNKMATRKTKITPMSNFFGVDHLAFHMKGKNCRDLFVEKVDEFFTDMDHHLYVTGQPGVGKTYLVENTAPSFNKVYLTTIKGKMSPWAFTKMMAVNVRHLKKGVKLAVYIDDINTMFKDGSEFVDIFKIAMDTKAKGGDCLSYNTSLGAQYVSAEDFEKEAIDYFKAMDPTRTGFVIPFEGRVKFIFTMNTPLPGKQEVDKHPVGSDKWNKLNTRAAIRSRAAYENLTMDKETYWGWITDVVWHSPHSMCVGATDDQRYEMLTWLWDNWEVASETSLRFVEEKMWTVMKKFPRKADYRTRWETLKG